MTRMNENNFVDVEDSIDDFSNDYGFNADVSIFANISTYNTNQTAQMHHTVSGASETSQATTFTESSLDNASVSKASHAPNHTETQSNSTTGEHSTLLETADNALVDQQHHFMGHNAQTAPRQHVNILDSKKSASQSSGLSSTANTNRKLVSSTRTNHATNLKQPAKDVWLSSSKQQSTTFDDTCVLPPDAGTCQDYVPRWFFNSQTGKCEQFSYGSCAGNTNNFINRQACEAKCVQEGAWSKSQLFERCVLRKDEGTGGGYNVKWYFNERSLRCEQMVYQGEGGNANQFDTLGECELICTANGAMNSNHEFARVAAAGIKQVESDPQAIAHDQTASMFTHEQQRQSTGRQDTKPTSGISYSNPQPTINDEQSSSSSQVDYSQTSSLSVLPPSVESTESPSATSEFTGYNAKLLEKYQQQPQKQPEQEEAVLASSAPMEINYQNGSRASGSKTVGINEKLAELNVDSIVAPEDVDQSSLLVSSNSIEERRNVPSCANSVKPMEYADGQPIMCLPGRNQCPQKSLCYFNGVDFYCCPNADDPYDTHAFGGNGGDEERLGYKSVKKSAKSVNEVNVKKLRLRRQAATALSIDDIARPVRIDSNMPRMALAKASAVQPSQQVITNPCLQNLDKGNCTEAHLRFFYDRRADTCRLFYYTGCRGNANNFATKAECASQCRAGKISQLDVLAGSCPRGHKPLGDNAPVLCGNQTNSFDCPAGYYCRMGPPHVCCPDEPLTGLEQILAARKGSENTRFAPQSDSYTVAAVEQQNGEEVTEGINEQEQKKEEDNTFGWPANMCPDGSMAILDETTNAPLKCGSGLDGQKMCPIGFYCSIDPDNNDRRLCCPMGVSGNRIPPPPNNAPYLGLRPSNPGEVIPRGSLPSDKLKVASKQIGKNENGTKLSSKASVNIQFPSEQTPTAAGEQAESEQYAHMKLKAENKNRRSEAFYNAMGNAAAAENDELFIDLGANTDPFESSETSSRKFAVDRSICHIKPSEGRVCRENETAPRTNLQYFYSRRDKRCKLYFYRGCGGNQNRFESKKHCQSICTGV